MNRVFLTGNLATDVNVGATSNGIPVATFQIAVSREYKDAQGNRQTDFLPVVCWRGLADICGRNLAKGRKVAVCGEIQTRSYQAKDGSTKRITEIVADKVEFLSPREQAAPVNNNEPQDGFIDISDATLPF